MGNIILKRVSLRVYRTIIFTSINMFSAAGILNPFAVYAYIQNSSSQVFSFCIHYLHIYVSITSQPCKQVNILAHIVMWKSWFYQFPKL